MNYEKRKVLLNAATVIVVILACFLLDALDKRPKEDDAYVLTKTARPWRSGTTSSSR